MENFGGSGVSGIGSKNNRLLWAKGLKSISKNVDHELNLFVSVW